MPTAKPRSVPKTTAAAEISSVRSRPCAIAQRAIHNCVRKASMIQGDLSEFREAALDPAQERGDREAGHDVEATRDRPGLDDPEGVDIDLASLERELRDRDRGGNRAVLEHPDERAPERWKHVAHHDGKN